MLSGILYAFSGVISDYLPPSKLPYGSSYVYQNILAYSNEYIEMQNKSAGSPLFLDHSGFDKFCPICKMGQEINDFRGNDQLELIVDQNFDAHNFAERYGLFLLSYQNLIKSHIDQLQLNWLTPNFDVYFIRYSFVRDDFHNNEIKSQSN